MSRGTETLSVPPVFGCIAALEAAGPDDPAAGAVAGAVAAGAGTGFDDEQPMSAAAAMPTDPVAAVLNSRRREIELLPSNPSNRVT